MRRDNGGKGTSSEVSLSGLQWLERFLSRASDTAWLGANVT